MPLVCSRAQPCDARLCPTSSSVSSAVPGGLRWAALALLAALGCAPESFSALQMETQDASHATAQPPADAGSSQPAATALPERLSSSWCQARQVLHSRCVTCHDGQGTGGSPMGLVGYGDLLTASTVDPSQRVYQRSSLRIHDLKRPMPPQGGLSAAELSALDTWLESAPGEQEPACAVEVAPAPVDLSWPSHCDAVYQLRAHAADDPTQPVTIAAGDEPHPQVVLDAPWGDEQVQAIAFRHLTDNRKVMHHWILYGNADDAFLTGWAPGAEQNAALPDDVGMYLPTGPRSMRLDMHYFNRNGTQAELDRSGVEVCVLKAGNFRKQMASVFVYFSSYGSLTVMAPARSTKHSITGKCRVQASEPVHVVTALPHAHARAVSVKFTVQKRDGSLITMLDSPFLFEEQHSYRLRPEAILETGDVVTTTCTYDNPTDQDLLWGGSSENEMCYNFAVYYPMGALSCEVDLIDRVFGS